MQTIRMESEKFSQSCFNKLCKSNWFKTDGDASYFATSKSGSTTLGEAGTAGFGTVRAGARERANVDLTQELMN